LNFADDMSEIDWDKESAEYFRLYGEHSDSPSSELGSEQCLSSDTSHTVPAVLDHVVSTHTEDSDADTEPRDDEKDSSSRPKRKKGKDRNPEPNPAVDAVRYKTKMCKNWQQFEKCPYGPRCLFAHGSKELRSYTVNHTAIASAATSGSPERQFYAIGHFPSFMPVPFQPSQSSTDETDSQPENPPCVENMRQMNTTESPNSAVTTHTPYALLPTSTSPVCPQMNSCGPACAQSFPRPQMYQPQVPSPQDFTMMTGGPNIDALSQQQNNPYFSFQSNAPRTYSMCFIPQCTPTPFCMSMQTPFLAQQSMHSYMQVPNIYNMMVGMDMRAACW
jgi:hypothetical protein